MVFWRNDQKYDGSIHCMGNGRLAAYGSGPEIIQVFGPPYSAQSFIGLKLDITNTVETRGEREIGTAVWKHTINLDGKDVGYLHDFVDVEFPCLIRKMNLLQKIQYTLNFNTSLSFIDNSASLSGIYRDGETYSSLLIMCEAGTFIYNHYPNPYRTYFQIVLVGNAYFTCEDKKNWVIHCNPGQSSIHFIGGPSYPECIENTEAIIKTGYEVMLSRTREYWRKFTERRKDFAVLLPQSTPHREKLMKVIDSVAVLVKAQQSREGAVLAGHNYHLGYVRDQYGVARGLLALGYTQEAKEILNFYWNIFKRHGKIHNAQAAGFDGIFHVHENDGSEITGYLILQAFDLYDETKDAVFLDEIMPMLVWAWNMQVDLLGANMLPFNGDETYVAGGMLPRSSLQDGSAEATLIFEAGGRRLIDWIEKTGMWSTNEVIQAKIILDNVRDSFRDNFCKNGYVLANNPGRIKAAGLPRFRHGVCEVCRCNMTWTQLNVSNRYVCPDCFAAGKGDKTETERYSINSVSLIPLYLRNTLLEMSDVKQVILDVTQRFEKTGFLPSRSDGNWAVGYDFGILLYNLIQLNHPATEQINDKMMSLLDQTDAWVEYYIQDAPASTRCRPWESAINLEAALAYALKDV